jgi:NAD(P)-dependent dehydrogenase (short-subunit alcohol dehydrogenase family)
VKTFVVTGATRGLGLGIAKALAKRGERVVLAVRDVAAGERVASELGNNASVRALDLSNLASVARFAKQWHEPLHALVNNAGVQIVSGTRWTTDGIEETMGINHVAAFALTQALLPHLAHGGRVLFIGSGTHNPTDPDATKFGFRGAQFTNLEALARGETQASSDAQAGRDRYATSKFLNMLSALAFSQRYPQHVTSFFTLDPGLMPGTGLARTAPWIQRAAWVSLLKWLAPLVAKGSSTPERSGEAAAALLTQTRTPACDVYGVDAKPTDLVWDRARDKDLATQVYAQTESLLESLAAKGAQ